MNHLIKAVLVTASLALSGCQVLDPYTGESKTSKATAYGLGAAVVCGLIGASKSGKRARNAAAGCGAIGATVGAYMDHQEKELRDKLVGTGVQVQRRGNDIQLIMPNNITFDTDKAILRSSFIEVLQSIILVLNHYPDTRLNIVGHTDSTGSDAYNLKLSMDRAQAVANYLIGQQVAPSRVTADGVGEKYPVASNKSETGRALNRRVELSISPIQVQ